MNQALDKVRKQGSVDDFVSVESLHPTAFAFALHLYRLLVSAFEVDLARMLKRAENRKVIRDNRVARGVCAKCGRHPLVLGLRQCAICGAADAKRRSQAVTNGLCVTCGKPAQAGVQRCETHRVADAGKAFFRNKRTSERQFARIGKRTHLPEWMIREEEEIQRRVRERQAYRAALRANEQAGADPAAS